MYCLEIKITTETQTPTNIRPEVHEGEQGSYADNTNR